MYGIKALLQCTSVIDTENWFIFENTEKIILFPRKSNFKICIHS